jgi:DME family drug/metabolite transporter
MSTSSCSRASSARTSLDLVPVVAAGLLWGTGGLSGALLGRAADLHPLAVATYRLAGGGVSLLILLAGTGRLRPLNGPAVRRVVLVGLLSALYQGCYFAAVSLTDLSLATLIPIGLAPVLVLVVEATRRRSVPAPVSLVAVTLAVSGLVLLVGAPGPGVGGARMAAGVALAVVTAAGFAGLALLGARPVAGLDQVTTIGWGFTAGAVPLAALAGSTVGLGFTPTAGSLGLLVYLAWVPTALAYALFFVGLRGVAASSAAVIAVLEPVTASVLGVLVLGQRMTALGVLGAAVLCVAVVVAGLGGGPTVDRAPTDKVPDSL